MSKLLNLRLTSGDRFALCIATLPTLLLLLLLSPGPVAKAAGTSVCTNQGAITAVGCPGQNSTTCNVNATNNGCANPNMQIIKTGYFQCQGATGYYCPPVIINGVNQTGTCYTVYACVYDSFDNTCNQGAVTNTVSAQLYWGFKC